MSGGRIQVGDRRAPRTCAYCSGGLEGVLAWCGRCGARYHSDCWTENRGCGSVGCSMRASPRGRPVAARTERLPRLPESPPPEGSSRPAPPGLSPTWAARGRAPAWWEAGGSGVRGVMWTAVAIHTVTSALLLVWGPDGLARRLEASGWVGLGGVMVMFGYLVLLLHANERFGVGGRDDPRGLLTMFGLAVPFSGAVYWALWGRQP